MMDASDWIGRTTEASDVASPGPLSRLRALMNLPSEDVVNVPRLGHWLYFLPNARQDDLGPDGHPHLGGELPDLGLPRRMWVGGRVRFDAPVPVGSPLVRRTVIRSIEHKSGRSGRLALLTLGHEISCHGTVAITEEQDLIYREAAPPGVPPPPRMITPQPLPEGAIIASHRFDETELFRFSALTYNAHRIHYDRDYARTVEGYPALVVHAPYQALHLLAHVHQGGPSRSVRSFSFRVHGPTFEGEEAVFGIKVADDGAALWLCPERGTASLTAAVAFA